MYLNGQGEATMTYHRPEATQLGNAVDAIQGDLGKPFVLFLDFRSILRPAMTIGAYEGDE